MNLDVVCFGALNVDKLYRVNRIAREDEESVVLDFAESPGGSAANVAIGLARLGLRVGYIGKVADDREGSILLNAFKREEVNTDGIVISTKGKSGIVMGYIDRNGERALYVDQGVNGSLEFDEIDLDYAGSADFLHLTSFVDEKQFESQKKLVETLSEGSKISLDPGNIYARRGLAYLKPLMKRSFIVFPNENEVRLLTGKGYEMGSRVLLKEGSKIVAVKLGQRGSYVANRNEGHLIAPYKVDVKDTTGAGDAFCAGVLYGLIKKKNLVQSGQLGNFVASRCVEKVGAREGLPYLSAMDLNLI